MFLTDLAEVLRRAGLNVVEIDGWQTRSRPASTGAFNPRGILCHHTGASAGGRSYAEWMALEGRDDLPAPLCQLALDRDGTAYVIAAGRANHAGVAKAQGTIPAGDGNELYLGIEAMNSGSEGFSAIQYSAYVKVCAALCLHYGWPVTNVRGHKETSVTGKWDPGLIDMEQFRVDVRALVKLGRHLPIRVWFANLDWSTGPRADRLHLLHLCRKADVLLLVECKNVDVFDLLPVGWTCSQDRSSEDRAGSVVAWRTGVFTPRRRRMVKLAERITDPSSTGMLARWANVQALKVRSTGETYRFVAAHYAPARYAHTWAATTMRLLTIRRRPLVAPVVIGTDANQPLTELATDLRLTAHGHGIVGILTPSRKVAVTEPARVDRFGLRHDATDHPAIGVTLHRKK